MSCCWGSKIYPKLTALLAAKDDSKLIQAGTLSFRLSESCAPKRECLCTRYNGWHRAQSRDITHFFGYLDGVDAASVKHLGFLADHGFAAVSFRIIPDMSPSKPTLVFRLYLIPSDTPKVRSVLLARDASKILGTGGKFLRALLEQTVRDRLLWNDPLSDSHGSAQSFFSEYVDQRTLAEIYSALPSPKPDSHGKMDKAAHDMLLDRPIRGLRSRLYKYQSKTVSEMIFKEQVNNMTDDPLYVKMRDLDGKAFYYQPVQLDFVLEVPRVTQSRGGILCEELGTGKTVMILALVLATVDVLPEPEVSLTEERPVYTPIWADYCHTAKHTPDDSTLTIPSLINTLLHYIRVHPLTPSIRESEDVLQNMKVWDTFSNNVPYYLEKRSPRVMERSQKEVEPVERVIYLTSATLIVVPTTLFSQWDSEITKHCDREFLRVLVVGSTGKLPAARRLAFDYDIVLMTSEQFTSEATSSTEKEVNRTINCDCPKFPETRVPCCDCDPNASLFQLRWKRLVVDEGHNTASRFTSLVHFYKALNVERRWIVTGTPTTNLLGINLGGNALAVDDDASDEGYPTDNVSTLARNGDGCGPGQDHFPVSASTRKWTRGDRTDLNKLSNMLKDFLSVPQFASPSKLFDTHVIQPLFDKVLNMRVHSVDVLTQVMSTVMVRHQIKDVEGSVYLPRIVKETVLLDLHSYAGKTYNILQAFVATNAIDSERTDRDYLFHRVNTQPLLRVIENISQCLFWHVDPDYFDRDLPQFAGHTVQAYDTAIKRNVSHQDISLLAQAVPVVDNAANDRTWREMHHGLEVPFVVRGLPDDLGREWASYYDEKNGWMNPSRILKLRQALNRNRSLSTTELSIYAQVVKQDEMEKEKAFLNRMNSKKRTKERQTLHEEAQSRANVARKLLGVEDSSGSKNASPTMKRNPNAMCFERWNGVTIGESTSSKLNFILEEVLRYCANEKFLIFSKSPLTLFHIAEALEVVGVKCLHPTPDTPPKVRHQKVTTFETSDEYRVFLLELKHGARGLNLVSASRVIFCEPVWQADVETQAIKRVHRIGQVKPVVVKTLAIRSTYEECMVKTRESQAVLGEKSAGLVEEQPDIRQFLENPTFVEYHCSRGDLRVVLISEPIHSSEEKGEVEVTDAEVGVTRKRVRFG